MMTKPTDKNRQDETVKKADLERLRKAWHEGIDSGSSTAFNIEDIKAEALAKSKQDKKEDYFEKKFSRLFSCLDVVREVLLELNGQCHDENAIENSIATVREKYKEQEKRVEDGRKAISKSFEDPNLSPHRDESMKQYVSRMLDMAENKE